MTNEDAGFELPELTEYLKSLGHSEDEIERIISKLQDRDLGIMVDSIMDSIDAGMFDIAKIIEEALGEEESDS